MKIIRAQKVYNLNTLRKKSLHNSRLGASDKRILQIFTLNEEGRHIGKKSNVGLTLSKSTTLIDILSITFSFGFGGQKKIKGETILYEKFFLAAYWY